MLTYMLSLVFSKRCVLDANFKVFPAQNKKTFEKIYNLLNWTAAFLVIPDNTLIGQIQSNEVKNVFSEP